MAISRNGWDVYTSRSHPKLVNFPWITGKVRDGDHFVVLDYIARRIHTEVEKIIKGNSWGHDPRPVRGYTDVWSEHATGTCFDFNAPKNGLGVPITRSFSAAQIQQIRQIIKDVRGAARWGGEWSRPDGMHVELIGGNAKVKEVADLIRAGKLPGLGKPGTVAPAGKPSAPKPSAPNAAYTAWVKDLQRNLNLWKTDLPKLRVDGDYGTLTKARVKEWQKRNKGDAYKGIYLDGDAGPLTTKGLGISNAPKK